MTGPAELSITSRIEARTVGTRDGSFDVLLRAPAVWKQQGYERIDGVRAAPRFFGARISLDPRPPIKAWETSVPSMKSSLPEQNSHGIRWCRSPSSRCWAS